jgi:nucleotide-binding universal stress UspA family protein
MTEPVAASAAPASALAPPAFADLLCAIDCSRASEEAARQASMLAAGGARLSFVCVAHQSGAGLGEQATISFGRGTAALEHAVKLAEGRGVRAITELVNEPAAAEVLLERAKGYDLLVVGSHGLSRRAGIMLGSVASAAAHRAPTSVLIARRCPAGQGFPGNLLVASDGSPGSQKAVEAAARIARRHGSSVLLFSADGEDAKRRHQLAEQAADLYEATATEPTVVTSPGDAHRLIVELADRERVSLIVIGSRGLGGVKALGSVSERVAHEAHCSVLIARGQTPATTPQRR